LSGPILVDEFYLIGRVTRMALIHSIKMLRACQQIQELRQESFKFEPVTKHPGQEIQV